MGQTFNFTLAKAIEEFHIASHNKAEGTRELYSGTLNRMLAFVQDIDLSAITIGQLRRWQVDLKQENHSVYTEHRHVRQTKCFFRWCIREGLLKQSPAENLEFPSLPKGEPPKAISEVDIVRMIETAKHVGSREYAFVRFLTETGCRLNGILTLTPENLDLDNNVAYVSEKFGKTRPAFFGKKTNEALSNWLKERPGHKGAVIFVGDRGPLTKSGARAMLNRIADKGAVTGRHNPHSFRHALARRLLRNGADMGTVSQILGHSDIETTHKFYACWTEKELGQRHGLYGGIIDD